MALNVTRSVLPNLLPQEDVTTDGPVPNINVPGDSFVQVGRSNAPAVQLARQLGRLQVNRSGGGTYVSPAPLSGGARGPSASGRHPARPTSAGSRQPILAGQS